MCVCVCGMWVLWYVGVVLPEASVLIVRMVDYRTSCTQFDGGHGRHGASEHRVCNKRVTRNVINRYRYTQRYKRATLYVML